MHFGLDLFFQDHFALSEDFLDVGTQFARFGIDDLEFLLDADGEDVAVFFHRWRRPRHSAVGDEFVSGRLETTDHYFAHPVVQFMAKG